MLFVSATMFAGNTVKVVNGKKEVKQIFADKAQAFLQVDWSEVKYDKSKTMQSVWEDKYDYFVKACEENLIKGFNDYSDKLKFTKEVANAKYIVILKLSNIDKYFNVMNIVPGHTVKIWGTFIITTVDGEKKVEIEIDSMKGGRDFSPDDCYTKAFKILGERIANLD